ncbi:MAG: F-type H+-transporting ATPase subunit a [bacterium P3]|nr:MAG: F-type H+-transporting ATPase subunit a [bacterium P3]KWW42117.1 MAG: F-type H+-transporting ATPase subunit a [bacterium F083]
MRNRNHILLCFLLLLATPLSSHAAGEFNAGDVIIGHVTDAHSWHLFDYVDRQGQEHAVAVPLPVILIHDGHLTCFSSSRFRHGHADYKGFRLVGGGIEKEEIVCVSADGRVRTDASGAVVKPLDLSVTKTSAAIMITVLFLVVIVFAVRHGYKKRGTAAPRGLQSLVEMLVVFVRDSIVRPMIGERHYERYLPYMLTLFFFIFLSNILGLIPFFPAGANITGNIAVTAILALITFFITNISGNKHYWVDIFNTPGVPAWLKIFPLMPVVELVGVFTKPIVLMVRLFANMTAGHIVILGFVVIIFILSNLFGTYVGGAVSVVSVLFSVFISLLECLVAYIQAFVFTMLSSLYIGMAVAEPQHSR